MLKEAWFRLLPLVAYEDDPGFREIILRLSRRGMFAIGLIVITATLAFVGAYQLFLGKRIAWSYDSPDPAAIIGLWEKLILAGLGVISILLSRTRFGPRWGRLVMAILLLIGAMTILLDDAARGNFSFSAGYLVLALLVVAGMMPYQPWQTFVLGLTLLAVYFLSLEHLPELLGTEIREGAGRARVIFMAIATIITTSITGFIYNSRYELYQVQRELERSLSRLKSTQAQLVQQEKLASLGALTAGIAHEIKNPLNFINNFAEVNAELAQELSAQLEVNELRLADVADVLTNMRDNAEHIVKQGQRADAIVRAMMLHARGTPGERQQTDLNALVEEYVNLAYHGMRAGAPGLTMRIERDYDEAAGRAEVVPQELGRVLINLLGNAFDAVHEKALSVNGQYAPVVSVRTRRVGEAVEIRVQDNGPGIPEKVRAKIFEPFFTTKPAGKGTGLGLSISYDIVVQGHGGRLEVESEEGEGAAFIITLPARPVPLPAGS